MPRKPSGNPVRSTVGVRLLPDERTAVETLAEARGVTPSEVLRDWIGRGIAEDLHLRAAAS